MSCIHPNYDRFTMANGEADFLTRREAAERYKISASTLARLASAGRGPTFYKPTEVALYLPEDVEAWIKAAIVRPSERRPAATEAPARGRGRRPAASAAPTDAEVCTPPAPSGRGRPRKNLEPSAFSTLRKDDAAA
jgi:hypothetical protein